LDEESPLFAEGVAFEVAVGVAAGAAGSGSPWIHHFFSPLMSVQIKVFCVISLTAVKPTSEFGQVRPGAATPCGYPSSGFAPLTGEINARVKAETRASGSNDLFPSLII
jgi:hypothetical protein